MTTRATNKSQSIQLQTLVTWDVTSVKSALNSLERGSYRRAAMLADFMLRDDRLAGILETRINAVLGLPVDFDPAPNNQVSETAAEQLRGGLYDRVMPEDTIREILKWGLLLNAAPVEIVWDTTEGEWTPLVTPFHPQFLEYNWQTRKHEIRTSDGVEVITQDDALDDPWVVFQPMGRHNAMFHGLIRRLAVPFLIRQWAWRDWARWSEKHGMPTTAAHVPSTASDEQRASFFADLIDLHNESTIELPYSIDPNTGERIGYTIEMLEAATQSWQGFEALKSSVDAAFAISILGQNLTTEVEGGSLAAANAHERIRRDYLRADSNTLNTLENEFIWSDWYALNHGGLENDAPKIMRNASPTPVEPAIQAHHVNAGIFTRNELRTRFGLDPLPPDEGGDDIVTGAGVQPVTTPDAGVPVE